MSFKLEKTGVIIDPNTFEPVINFKGTINWRFDRELTSVDFEKIGKDFINALKLPILTTGVR